MDYKLQPGKQSNYQITITLTPDELASYKDAALQQFQKDANIEGFRPGHAPLSMIEQRISPEYLKVAMFEEAIHTTTTKMLAEHPDKKFIGQLYQLEIDDKKPDIISLTFNIDVYPEVVEKSDAWKKIKPKALETDVSDKEVDETVMNLRRQYADYQPTTTIGPDSVFKVGLQFLDAKGAEIHTGKLYLGKEDIAEFPQLADYFMGKAENDVVTIPYEEKKLPHTMHLHKEGLKAKTIHATVGDIRNMILPEFTPETIKKFFGNDDVQTEDELKKKIKVLIGQQKEEAVLMQAIDMFLQEAMKSFTLTLPKTLIEEEVKTRQKSLTERMGGEEGVKKYFDQIGEEEVKKLHTNISDAAKSSLEKFLILKSIVEALGITDINREGHLDVEKKLYAKLTTK